MSTKFADEHSAMQRAIDLAAARLGYVEPNPPVGAVIVDDELRLLGEGCHEVFGGPHAEVNAIRQAGDRARGATLFVTLEPCCRQGKTGPCTQAVIEAGLQRVVVAVADPSMEQGGIESLRAAGIDVQVGLLEAPARRLVAPFLKRIAVGRPYVHAKWAMTLDGKIASRTGQSQWISGESSRAAVHRLRGRMDALVVGASTVRHDDPRLTARPPGPRVATRIVIDRDAALPLDSQLVETAADVPVLVASLDSADAETVRELKSRGVEVLSLPASPNAGDVGPHVDLELLLAELGKREMTNVLVEGGGALLGSFFDAGLVDEVHVFVAPRIIGGREAVTPVAGHGLESIVQAFSIDEPSIELLDEDVYIHGPLKQP